MELIEKITLDALTPESVSVLRQSFIELNGELVKVGDNIRNAYSNTERERGILAGLLPAEYLNAVLAVWGEASEPDLPE